MAIVTGKEEQTKTLKTTERDLASMVQENRDVRSTLDREVGLRKLLYADKVKLERQHQALLAKQLETLAKKDLARKGVVIHSKGHCRQFIATPHHRIREVDVQLCPQEEAARFPERPMRPA